MYTQLELHAIILAREIESAISASHCSVPVPVVTALNDFRKLQHQQNDTLAREINTLLDSKDELNLKNNKRGN